MYTHVEELTVVEADLGVTYTHMYTHVEELTVVEADLGVLTMRACCAMRNTWSASAVTSPTSMSGCRDKHVHVHACACQAAGTNMCMCMCMHM